MKAHWITAALLSTALVTACNTQNPQNIEDGEATAPAADETVAPDTTAPPPPPDPVSPSADSAARSNTTPSRPSTRPAPAPRPAPSAPAPRAESTPEPSRPAAREEPPAPPRAEYREVSVPAGTALPLELRTALSSETATVEMPVSARLKQAISVDGYTLLPAGTQLNGTVTEVAKAGRVKGRARVTIAFDQAIVNGARESLKTDPVTFEAQGTRGEDATKIGAGAGIGAAIGGILGGGSGAAKGAIIGGAAGTGAVLATKGQHVEVAEGADIAATLADAFELRVRAKQ